MTESWVCGSVGLWVCVFVCLCKVAYRQSQPAKCEMPASPNATGHQRLCGGGGAVQRAVPKSDPTDCGCQRHAMYVQSCFIHHRRCAPCRRATLPTAAASVMLCTFKHDTYIKACDVHSNMLRAAPHLWPRSRLVSFSSRPFNKRCLGAYYNIR